MWSVYIGNRKIDHRSLMLNKKVLQSKTNRPVSSFQRRQCIEVVTLISLKRFMNCELTGVYYWKLSQNASWQLENRLCFPMHCSGFVNTHQRVSNV